MSELNNIKGKTVKAIIWKFLERFNTYGHHRKTLSKITISR